ncbi:MAG: LytTR family DNA-binding domain-containing protein [Bacteroides sp.]|nr:LytTR family DNA-binding domain-containing protein [Bacteroides sp.]
MPLTIAVCDDNEAQITELRRLLDRWSEDKPFALEIDEYVSAEGFLFSYPDKPCDILLLDIEMKEISGMELAKKLRAEGDRLPIVFITGYSEHIGEGYEVEALHYLLKPLNEEKLFNVLDRYIKRRFSKKDEILLQCREKLLHVSAEEIVYIEAAGKRTIVKLADGGTVLCESGIGEAKKALTEDFILCHRSFAVNIRFIRSISADGIALDSGEKIPVSRRMQGEVNKRFIEFYKR